MSGIYISKHDKRDSIRSKAFELIFNHLREGYDLESWENQYNICTEICSWASEKAVIAYHNEQKEIHREKLRLKRQEERERESREVITEAYNSCNYRKSKRTHKLNIIFHLGSAPYGHPSINCVRGFGTAGTVHNIFVRPNYLKRMSSLSFYTFDNSFILDADFKGFSTKGMPVYSLRLARQGVRYTIWVDPFVVISFRPLAGGGSTQIEKYNGKVTKRKEMCRMLDLDTNTPDCLIVDKFEESEIIL